MAAEASEPGIDVTRREQMFPTLTAPQIAAARRFASGEPQRFAAGADIYELGARGAPVWLVLEGGIEVVRRDGLGHEAPIVTHGPGQFSGEISQLGGVDSDRRKRLVGVLPEGRTAAVHAPRCSTQLGHIPRHLQL